MRSSILIPGQEGPSDIGVHHGLGVLESTAALRMLDYLLDNGPCRKGDIYRDVNRNPRIPSKLSELEACGLIRMVQLNSGSSVEISLTDKGRRVAELVSEIGKLLENDGAEAP